MFAQTERPIRFTTPLGEDMFIVASFSGSEYISGIYQFEVKALWQGDDPIKFQDLLGQSATVEIEMFGAKRYYNGIVKAISQGARVYEENLTWYYITIVPRLWLLTRRVNCRIFQHKKATDIIEQVLIDAGVTQFEAAFQGTYQPRDYCVQYYESDFDFISRLMEYEGICYYFKHTDGDHTLVLSDDKSSFVDLPNGADVEYEEVFGGLREVGRIYEWRRSQEINSGKFSLTDYNFTKPALDLSANAETIVQVAHNSRLELYEYPGAYETKDAGDEVTKLRIAAEEARTQSATARSINVGMCPGYKFNLKNHFSDEGPYAITAVTHLAQQPLRVEQADQQFTYQNEITCIAGSVQYRPQRVTPLPTTRGVQTALVVGPGGEEIYTDEYGRVKVQFYWDRLGAKDENSSCWVRVATYWAGKAWGAIHIPRIGQEVIVDFVDGDVDRPIIIGSVYNAQDPVPYSLPAEKTKSTLKSNSSKGGGGFNEFRFEDKKGSEEVFFHAEKDLNSVIKNNETREVGNDRTTQIKHDETQTVTNNETIVVDQGNQSITLNQGNQTTLIKMGNQSTELKMGNQSILLDMGNQSTELKMGNQSTKCDLGAISVEAMQSITLKVGMNSITIDQTGVTVSGMMVKIQGQVQIQASAPIVQVQGSGLTQITGGIVMIN